MSYQLGSFYFLKSVYFFVFLKGHYLRGVELGIVNKIFLQFFIYEVFFIITFGLRKNEAQLSYTKWVLK